MTYTLIVKKRYLKALAVVFVIVALASTNYISYECGAANQKVVTKTITEFVTNTEIVYKPQTVNGSNLQFHNLALENSVLDRSEFGKVHLFRCYVANKSVIVNSVINCSAVVDSTIINCTIIDSNIYGCVIFYEYANNSVFKNCTRPTGYEVS